MTRNGRIGIAILCVLGLRASLTARALDGVPVEIPRTTLKVVLPAGWRVDVNAQDPIQPQLRYSPAPDYAITVGQSTSASTDRSCMEVIGSLASIGAINATVVDRPSFMPSVFQGLTLTVSGGYATCFSTGPGLVIVQIRTPSGSPTSSRPCCRR